MFIDCNYIALNNANDLLPYGTYKSGILDGEKAINIYAYPSSTYPILNLAYILNDFQGNVLTPGHYEVVLAPSRKMIYLVESGKIKASVPVTKLVEKMVSDEEEREALEKQQKLAKKYKHNPKKRPKDTSAMEQQADMEASIKDSGDNYYILNYKNRNIQASGYILK